MCGKAEPDLGSSPYFVYKFGDSVHHDCPRVKGSNLNYAVHCFFDKIFYRVMDFLRDKDGASFYPFIRTLLSFIWGLNCGFPFRDVVLYTVWYVRGCE